MSDDQESESTDQLIEDVDEERVKVLSDKDIDTRLELLDVKLQQNDLIMEEQKKENEKDDNPMALVDIQPSSDGDFMD